jgi:phage protein D
MLVDPLGLGQLPENACRVMSFEYTDSERQADKLKLTIDNYTLFNFDDPVWKKGNIILASWGYPDRMAPRRRLVITKVSGSVSLSIEARAQSLLMNRVVQNRIFENMRRSDVVRQVAVEHGYTDADVDIEDTSEVRETIQQCRLTDAQFIRRLANEEGFEFFVDFDGFHFHQRRVDQRPVRVYRYFHDPNMGEVLSFNVENDVTAKPGRVRVRARDSVNGETVEGQSGNSPNRSEDQSNDWLNELSEIIDPETRGSREPTEQEQNVAQEDVRPSSSGSQEGVQRTATARARRHRQTAVKLSLECIGDPRQLAKTVIQTQGMGKRLSIRYYVKEVVHKISAGYLMTIKAVSDGHGGHSTRSRIARGVELLDPGAPSRGRVNQQNGETNDEQNDSENPGDLNETEMVDPETRRSRIVYQQRQNRDDGRSEEFRQSTLSTSAAQQTSGES